MRVPIDWLKNYVNIPKDTKRLTDRLTMVGHMLDKIETGKEGMVLDLELRGNRADCYSIYGIAKEVSALFGVKLSPPKLAKKPKKVSNLKGVSLKVDQKYVKRVMMVTIKNIKIEKSPKWLAASLKAYGVDSINNIVDLTNYVAIETGNPLHAFDLDQIGKDIEIRLAKKGEKVTTFHDNNISLTNEDLVWSDKRSVLSLAGAIGSKKHGVSKNTKTILLEGASYEQANIRRTVHRHNLFTEAGIRHEKNLDPNEVENAILRFVYLVEENSWGNVEKEIYDFYPHPVKSWPLTLSLYQLRALSGIALSKKEASNRLKSLGFEILKSDSKTVKVKVPTSRTDVTLEEDLVEEVVRIVGYDQIPEKVLSLEIPENITPKYIKTELSVKEDLVALGFDEVISSSFVKETMQKLNVKDGASPVSLENFPSPDIKDMRTSLLPNLVEFCKKVINERGEEARFFEIGKIYFKDREYHEVRKLGIAYWRQGGEFTEFKGLMDAFNKKANLPQFNFTLKTHHNLTNSYDIEIKSKRIGYGGIYKDIFFAELDLEMLQENIAVPKANLWPKYPPQIEDITLQLPERTHIGAVMTAMRETNYVSHVELVDQYKDYYTFKLWYQDTQKTLNNDEVKKIRDRVLQKVQEKFGALFKE